MHLHYLAKVDSSLYGQNGLSSLIELTSYNGFRLSKAGGVDST